MNYEEIAKRLSKKENWTDELRYVHYTRFAAGFMAGFLCCLYVWLLF